MTASPGAIVTGMHSTFIVAAILIAGALVISLRLATRDQSEGFLAPSQLSGLDAKL